MRQALDRLRLSASDYWLQEAAATAHSSCLFDRRRPRLAGAPSGSRAATISKAGVRTGGTQHSDGGKPGERGDGSGDGGAKEDLIGA